jgi:hypothetical protein
MNRTHVAGVWPELRRDWRRWTLVVELFTRQARARLGVRPQDYERLHAGLLASCRALLKDADEAGRLIARSLEQLAGPWPNTGALEQADREILFDLLGRCREAGRRLGC